LEQNLADVAKVKLCVGQKISSFRSRMSR